MNRQTCIAASAGLGEHLTQSTQPVRRGSAPTGHGREPVSAVDIIETAERRAGRHPDRAGRRRSALPVPPFLSPRNISNILAQTAVIAVVAMGQHLVILTRGIDLSVGSNLALATVVGALVFKATGSAVLTMLAMLLSGALVGAINGMVFVYGRLPHPFIITLATLSIAKGLALELADRPDDPRHARRHQVHRRRCDLRRSRIRSSSCSASPR